MAGKILDQIDAAIVDLLQEDGRMSAVDVASRLEGVTPRVVRHRIKKLVHDGIISVSAVVHPKALGYAIMADVLIEAQLGLIPDIARRLSELEHVTYTSCATGESDISIQVVARSVEELYRVIQEEIHQMPGVSRTRTYVLPLALKFTYDWKIPQDVYCDVDSVHLDGKPGAAAPEPRSTAESEQTAGK
jgi:Lrp/AsnC family transcriptional regulator for asnA, asnC and gidA